MFGRLLSVAVLFVSSMLGVHAQAFPEMVRQGYVNCTTCHVSPTGGGTMTPYGRALSRELLSTWGREKEEGLLHGVVDPEKMPEWLVVGGDIRALQTYLDSPSVKQGNFIWMQADLEVALRKGPWTVDGTIGRIEKRGQPPGIESRRYYVMYQPTDELAVRAGRFMTAFGLNIPDHNVATRRGVGLDQGRENNNVELSWTGEVINAFATLFQNRGEIDSSAREGGVALQGWYALKEKYKLGASLWSSGSSQRLCQMAGLHGIFGFTKQFYLLSEADLRWDETTANNSSTRGLLNFQRLGYEFHKGAHVFLQNEYAQTNLQDGTTAAESFGLGFLFYPRPHFEFQLVLSKARARSGAAQFDDVGTLVGHYYF